MPPGCWKVAPSCSNTDPAPGENPAWTPLHRWQDPLFEVRDVAVWIKRDDLTDPWTGGNKRRKLLHWLHPDQLAGMRGIYSFGGPFSNHLTAVAAAAARLGLPSYGFVRSWQAVENPLTRQWKAWGMALTFLPPADFRDQTASPPAGMGDWLGIPMGGAHPLAFKGAADLIHEIRRQCPFRITHYAVPAGTGATAAGMAGTLEDREALLVYPVLRLPDGQAWLRTIMDRWGVATQGTIMVDEGGPRVRLGRADPVLWSWMRDMAEKTGILLDPLYTGPMARRLQEQILAGAFPPGSTVVLVHTGGQAGRLGYQWRFGLPPLDRQAGFALPFPGPATR